MADEPEVAQCIVHMHDFDAECELCKTELEASKALLNTQVAGNQQTEMRLKANNVGMEGSSVINLRLNTLLDVLLNPKQRALFERKFMTNYAEALRLAEDQIARQRLLGGIQFGGPMPRPG